LSGEAIGETTAQGRPVLVVDLDGTLIKGDMLDESLLLLLKKNILFVFLLPLWLLQGRARLKHEIARRVEVDATRLPYRENVVEYVRKERAHGRKVVLATASDRSVADRVAAHLELFDEVLASDGTTNLKSKKKLAELESRFGTFAYIGDAQADLPIWKRAAEALVVVDKERGERRFAGISFAHIFVEPEKRVRALVKAIRPHQWAKNLLIFVPLVLAHRIDDLHSLVAAALAFVAFSLTASSVYVLNDLLDIPADRHHHKKRMRPFASGALSVRVGLTMAPALIVGAIVPTLFLPTTFAIVLAAYFATTFAYSLVLKRIAIVDVLTLAGLYTVRIAAGAEATGVQVTSWLQGFSLFLFLSLAFIKRYTELKTLEEQGKEGTVGRGYVTSDLTQVASLGAASAYVAVLVLALYVSSSDITRLYTRPNVLWGMIPLFLYWTSRMWFLAGRGQMDDDPVVFAVRDPASYVTAFLLLLVVLFAL
jgi:4-hydroxybenzoate polyprenyltransferase/phosphoserine phosphatase